MSSFRIPAVISLVAAFLALSIGAVSAQDESAAPSAASGPVIDVVAQDYHFEGLPTSLPVGSSVTLTNEGTELHELIIARKNDGVTESFDELLALPQEEALQKVTVAGILLAAPGEAASVGMTAAGAPMSTTAITLDQEGDYIALCTIPQGTTEMPDFMAQAEAPEGSAAPPDASMAPQGPPHFMLGMKQEFTVTAAGTAPGPVPSAPSA